MNLRMQPIYLVVGCPGAGKSWVCEQLDQDFKYVHHDLFVGMAGTIYVHELMRAACDSGKPVLGEAPFSISTIKDPLESMGFQVKPVFIIEEPHVITERYLKREKKMIPKGHLTRQKTYEGRAKIYGSFAGTSAEVLEHLKQVAQETHHAE